MPECSAVGNSPVGAHRLAACLIRRPSDHSRGTASRPVAGSSAERSARGRSSRRAGAGQGVGPSGAGSGVPRRDPARDAGCRVSSRSAISWRWPRLTIWRRMSAGKLTSPDGRRGRRLEVSYGASSPQDRRGRYRRRDDAVRQDVDGAALAAGEGQGVGAGDAGAAQQHRRVARAQRRASALRGLAVPRGQAQVVPSGRR